MGEIRMKDEGKYIYCIIQNERDMDFGPIGIGERGDRVHTVSFQDISAVVSDSPIKKYSVGRDNLIPHERVIEEVMKTFTVLPVRFCTIADDETQVKKILEKEHNKFLILLKDMEDKKELGLKAVFKEDIIYKDILAGHNEIRTLKERIGKEPAQSFAHQKLIEVGRLVESALEEEKAECKEEILSVLTPLAADVKSNNTYGERMIINAAFLIEKERETEFDEKVQELSERYGEKIKFKYVGTLPPFNFVNIEINTEDY
jgi:hypothetical protein